MNVSVLQQNIFDNVSNGVGHTVVKARAGSGKTTTIMGSLASVPTGMTVALFAFNKSIATELGRRAPKGVEVKTLHAHGFSSIRRSFRNVTVNNDKTLLVCETMFGEPINDHPVRGHYRAIASLVAVAKDTMVTRGDLVALDSLVDDFGIDAPEAGRSDFIAAAMKVLEQSAELTHIVDFSDMCWLPVVLRLRVWAFDHVFVDETQDLSPSQVELLLMSVKRGGRITAVGDDRQAIYAFRGADVNTIPNLIDRLNAKVLPLSVTYRCCRAVADMASTEVRDLSAAPGAVLGSVSSCGEDEMLTCANVGDMIISRSNAPLMGYCLRLLKIGKRAAIKGRDVGAGLIAMIKKSKATSVDGLLTWATAWHKKETERLAKKEKSTDPADDKLECIYVLADGATSINEVIDRAKNLFSDDGDVGRITLGTTHKLKGLEADRVWMLENTYRRHKGGEEANCWYVAVTRAKSDLRLVSIPK